MSPLEKNIMRPKRKYNDQGPKDAFEERVIEVNRVSRTVKGGRRIRFRALVVIGDKNGKVAMGMGKSGEVSEAVSKAASRARKSIIEVPIINGTIPHEVIGQFGAAKVLLKPASDGTSVVAGGSVRVVAELAGISDLLAKSLGSRSKINNIAATIVALSSFNKRAVSSLEKYKNVVVAETKADEETDKEQKAEEKKVDQPAKEVVSNKKDKPANTEIDKKSKK
ncbi:MAG: 30S ribosomal protein S5 [bacterium ADurb.Bin212]|nr:MAG: 30S ribosomal protein S5 [bacterium ADurb.Bin212]